MRDVDKMEMKEPTEPRVTKEMPEMKEIDAVRGVIHIVLCGMNGGETWNEQEKHYCRVVNYGVLESALEVLRRYEKLLAKEPLIEQIANEWRKTGAFYEDPEGVR